MRDDFTLMSIFTRQTLLKQLGEIAASYLGSFPCEVHDPTWLATYSTCC